LENRVSDILVKLHRAWGDMENITSKGCHGNWLESERMAQKESRALA
jgi:hypothetical protein